MHYVRYSNVRINGVSIGLDGSLSQCAFMVLSVLNMHFNEFVGAQYLADKCAPGFYLQDWNARIHIVKIRNALKNTPYEIVTARGTGYKLTKRK